VYFSYDQQANTSGKRNIMQEPHLITELLLKWGQGDSMALERLIPLVYDELRLLAKRYLRREHYNISLEPTIIVHEIYLRLIEQKNLDWQHRAQFFALAAKLIRNILVDHARHNQALKRGGKQYKISLSDADRLGKESDVELIALNDALDKLADLKPEHSRSIELRFFGGLTVEETAEVMGISQATVQRYWNFSKAWLYHEMKN
jgi:RNA polymerase sigma factor (TIGR02999 family)